MIKPTELETSSSFDWLARHASATPDRIALAGPGREIPWGRFHADASRVARSLMAMDVGPGKVVAISHPDRYVHWLLCIACEAVGAVSASFESREPDQSSAGLLELADMILSENDRLNDRWLAEVLAGPVAADPPCLAIAPDAPFRIIRTSGTTGRQKCLPLTRRMRAHWVGFMLDHVFSASDTRYYAAYGLTVNPTYYRMETCLRIGGCVILGEKGQDLITYRASHCWLLPRDMALMLEGVRGPWPSAQPLHMTLGGGSVSPALHDRVTSTFGTELRVTYGTNEAGLVALLDRDGIGTPVSGGDIEILDDSGAPVAVGSAGRIRLRTTGVAVGYLDDPEATAAVFQQGWVVTDDVGTRLADGKFRLTGRSGEIINLGGLKMTPSFIEDGLRAAVPGIRDIAVTSILNDQGVEELCIAVVPAESGLLQRVGAALDPSLGRSLLLGLNELPMAASGKIRRSALRDLFIAARPRD